MAENILIINIHSSQNLGDAALLKVTLQQFQSNFQYSKITLCIDDAASSPEDLPKVEFSSCLDASKEFRWYLTMGL